MDDQQIYSLPACARPGCEAKGFVGINGLWLCGECTAEFFKKKQKYVLETLGEKTDE